MRLLFTSVLIAFAIAQKPLDSELTDIFGRPPGLESESEAINRQLLKIYGTPPPVDTRVSEDELNRQLLDIYGSAPTLEPIYEWTLPPNVYLDIFGPDENDITEKPEDGSLIVKTAKIISPTTIRPEIIASTTTRSEITASTTIRPEITASTTIRPETTSPQIRSPVITHPRTEVPSKVTTQIIEIKPTEASTTLVGQDGAPCKCLPYFLCNRDHMGVDYNNASVTGYGELDIRFGEDDKKPTRKCQETVELCCTIPKDPQTIPQQPEKPKLKGCGYRNPKGIDFTLSGGTGREAEYGEFPWVVALVATNGSLMGVGAIIHPQVIVTGAHVATKFIPGTLRVRAGEWDTSTEKERLPYQEREIQEIYSHDDFHPKSLRNDLALLRLAEPLKLDVHINMICLPDQDESFDASIGCIANGWGKDVFGLKGRYAVILKKVELNMVPYNRCSALLKNTRLGPHFVLHPSFVCAGGEEGKDTCTGDGGAPLVCPLGNDRFKLTGLVAWGVGCGGKDIPAVYAGVSNFRTLIDAKMNEWGYGVTSYSI